MPLTRAGNVELYYETVGRSDDDPMLLIMGVGMQLTGWDEGFCQMLANAGFFVIRYDNRDVGLSTHVEAPAPNLPAILLGDRTSVPYTLGDLAGDAVGLLDALGVDRAHVVGASMGAMVAQVLAIDHPDRVLSLSSIMGTTGDHAVGRPSESAISALIAVGNLSGSGAADRELWVERRSALSRTIGSTGFRSSDRQLQAFFERDFDRSSPSREVLHHLAAVLAADDRSDALQDLKVPALVIHGTDDVMVDVSGGHATARQIPNAELLIIEGMGHDLPYRKWPEITSAIVRNARRART